MAAKKVVKKNFESPLPPSANMVDAYKTYLQKAMPTITAKDFAEGAPIPTDQVEKDILILESFKEKFAIYYNAKTKNPFLLVNSHQLIKTPETTNLMFRVGKSEVDQKFIMRMGMLSNCNVSIAKTDEFSSNLAGNFVLTCSKCNGQAKLTQELLVAKENALASKIEEFCVAHKHDRTAPDKEGRLFRVED